VVARRDLVIVGLGSAGIVAAQAAAAVGLDVVAVERARVGGDCLWTGCVPSKALLASARLAHAMRTADRLGLPAHEPAVDTARVLARVRSVQAEIARTDDNPDHLRALGVDVRLGAPATLAGPHRVRVGEEEIRTRFVLLCTGSHPTVPPIPGLREAGFLTSETLWDLERLPRSVVLVGGGPIAAELAQALTRLGTRTTVLQRDAQLLARDEPELAARLVARLEAEGVQVRTGVEVERVSRDGGRRVVHGRDGEHWSAEAVVLGTGRTPATEGLGLEGLGIEVSPAGVEVDDRSRTTVPSVYAVGDLAGRPHHFTHSAASEAATALRDMFFPGRARFSALVPWCTFTEPELAHAGLTGAEARERHAGVTVHRFELTETDRGRTDAVEEGLVLVVAAKGRAVGAHVLAPGAGELIHELALAVIRRTRVAQLADLVHVYPTLATSVAQLGAREAFADAARYRWLVRAGRFVSARRAQLAGGP